ncbi:MAG: sugar ABC transporter substrate-binding protein [Candidatus Limnocylindrales bacterium]
MIKPTRAALAALTVLSIIATACSDTGGSAAPAPAAASGSAAANAKPYAGQTLRVLAANHPWADALKPLLPDLEAKTGIKVNLEQYGEDQLTQKLTTEFTAGSSDIDAFMQRPLQEAKLHQQNGYYQDLNLYLKDSKKTPADYDLADISKAAFGTETVGDVITGVPIVVEAEVLYYRKDLLQAAGIAVPKTLEELKAAAAKLTDKSKEQYGFVARGQRSPAVTQFSSFLYSYGGDWFDLKTKKASIDTPEFRDAVTFYGSLLKDYGPPGVLNMSFPQAAAIMSQGKAAMYTDANSIYQLMLDPKQSQVADKMGVAAFPAGPKGANMYNVTSWGLSMPAKAPHKDAAWEFIKWATSKEIVIKTQASGAVPGARKSAFDDPAGKAKFPADWSAAAAASANGRGYDRPLVVQVGKGRDIIGEVITVAIQGGDVAAAAKKGQTDFQALLDSEK